MEQEYQLQDLDHKHILINAAVRKPPIDTKYVEDWFKRLIEAVGMKVVIGPHAINLPTPGNEGITAICCIETSHCSLHVWEKAKVPFIRFDLYSCKSFDVSIVVDFLKEFDPYHYTYALVDRNKDTRLQKIEENRVQVITVQDLLPEEYKIHYKTSYKKRGKNLTPEEKKARTIYQALSVRYSFKASNRKYNQKWTHQTTLNGIRNRAMKNSIPYDLDSNWFDDAYQKAKIKWPKLELHAPPQHFWGSSVDKINPLKGYTKDNCRIVPYCLNVAKWYWNEEQTKELFKVFEQDVKDRGLL